eukprot:Skav207807  [mRNA]  locus=scaffold381:220598:227597:+ [translate_table: standard]
MFSYGLHMVQRQLDDVPLGKVGIEDCLHIEFEYDKSKYHMKDVIVGKVYFLLVRIKIKHMELNIIRRESTGTGAASAGQQTDNETLTKFEIMDGAPVKDQCIPVRLYLNGFDLTPTYKISGESPCLAISRADC